MIKRRLLTAVVAVIAAVAVSAFAQTGTDVRYKLKRAGFDQFPISVEDFTIVRGPVSHSDSILAANLAQIVRNDLAFHVAFDLVPMDSFLLEVLEYDTMTMQAWKFMGSEYLVRGEVEFEGDNVRATYRLWDLVREREIRSDGFRTARLSYRSLAHSISDDVVTQVSGMKPLFNSKLAFISARSGNKEVYMCDYDGANEKALTSNGSINLSPVWDAKGKSIYYTSYKDDWPQLWNVNLNGGKHTKVAAYKGLNAAAAVSPSNDEICLTLTKDGNAELYLIDTGGKINRRLTNTRADETSPSFGPDGNSIAFVSDRTGSPQIYLMDSEGLNATRVTYKGGYNASPSMSPDGSKIAFVTRTERGGFDICVVDVTGENFRVITSEGSNENPSWAPDSYHLVYSTRRGDVFDIYIADYQGISRLRVSSDGRSSNPDWSPYLW